MHAYLDTSRSINAELGADENVVAELFQNGRDELLVMAVAIDISL